MGNGIEVNFITLPDPGVIIVYNMTFREITSYVNNRQSKELNVHRRCYIETSCYDKNIFQVSCILHQAF